MDAQPKNFAVALAELVKRSPQHRNGGQITPTTNHNIAGKVKCWTFASLSKNTWSASSICTRCIAPFFRGLAGALNDAAPSSSRLAGAAAPGMSVTDAVGRMPDNLSSLPVLSGLDKHVLDL